MFTNSNLGDLGTNVGGRHMLDDSYQWRHALMLVQGIHLQLYVVLSDGHLSDLGKDKQARVKVRIELLFLSC